MCDKTVMTVNSRYNKAYVIRMVCNSVQFSRSAEHRSSVMCKIFLLSESLSACTYVVCVHLLSRTGIILFVHSNLTEVAMLLVYGVCLC